MHTCWWSGWPFHAQFTQQIASAGMLNSDILNFNWKIVFKLTLLDWFQSNHQKIKQNLTLRFGRNAMLLRVPRLAVTFLSCPVNIKERTKKEMKSRWLSYTCKFMFWFTLQISLLHSVSLYYQEQELQIKPLKKTRSYNFTIFFYFTTNEKVFKCVWMPWFTINLNSLVFNEANYLIRIQFFYTTQFQLIALIVIYSLKGHVVLFVIELLFSVLI